MPSFADILSSHGLRRALLHWRQTRDLRGDLAGLSAQERDALFRDLSLDEASMSALEEGAHDTEGLTVALARLGIDADNLRDRDVKLLAQLRRECAMCSDWTRCAHDFESGTVSGAAPSYCPNRATLEALADASAGRLPKASSKT